MEAVRNSAPISLSTIKQTKINPSTTEILEILDKILEYQPKNEEEQEVFKKYSTSKNGTKSR